MRYTDCTCFERSYADIAVAMQFEIELPDNRRWRPAETDPLLSLANVRKPASNLAGLISHNNPLLSLATGSFRAVNFQC